MRTLIHKLLGDWQVWALIAAPTISVIVAIFLAVWFSRTDTQQRLDTTVTRLEHRMDEMVEKIQRNRQDLNEVKRQVEEVVP